MIESVRETYYDFIEFVENPAKRGYMTILCKLKPQSRELVKARLIDNWKSIDDDLRYVRSKMRGFMGWYDDDQPDGIKQ